MKLRNRDSVYLFRDALHNLAPEVAFDAEHRAYARGIVTGLLTALVCEGYLFDTALKLISEQAPENVSLDCIPAAWEDEWRALRPQPEKKINGPEA